MNSAVSIYEFERHGLLAYEPILRGLGETEPTVAWHVLSELQAAYVAATPQYVEGFKGHARTSGTGTNVAARMGLEAFVDSYAEYRLACDLEYLFAVAFAARPQMIEFDGLERIAARDGRPQILVPFHAFSCKALFVCLGAVTQALERDLALLTAPLTREMSQPARVAYVNPDETATARLRAALGRDALVAYPIDLHIGPAPPDAEYEMFEVTYRTTLECARLARSADAVSYPVTVESRGTAGFRVTIGEPIPPPAAPPEDLAHLHAVAAWYRARLDAAPWRWAGWTWADVGRRPSSEG